MSELFDTAWVEKRNVLNELRSNNMTLQELRLFSIYLSKINPWDKSTRFVRFPLDDFRRIMGLNSGENIAHFRQTIRHILQQIVEIPNEHGSGYTAFQLFKRAKVEKNENDEWYVELDAHDDALPLMFDFKNRYFKYELWNALRLKSPNQVRMYEILKQYENLHKRELTVSELRELLGIGMTEYTGRTGWSNFKKKVLDSCQQALKETTDICYTYERGKTGKGGKWLSVIFHITKNKDYKEPLTLAEFIEEQPKESLREPAEETSASKSSRKTTKRKRLAVKVVASKSKPQKPSLLEIGENGEFVGDEHLSILAEAVDDEFGKEDMEQISITDSDQPEELRGLRESQKNG